VSIPSVLYHIRIFCCGRIFFHLVLWMEMGLPGVGDECVHGLSGGELFSVV